MHRMSGSGRSALVLLVVVASTAAASSITGRGASAADQTLEAQVLRGRQLVVTSGCGDCHGGWTNPAAEGWLAGAAEGETSGDVVVFPPNLTPDRETGLGRYTDRQVFNALRFGLRPAVTPDVEVTSAVPGQGNHPASPTYLAPFMPWPSFRHLSDGDMWDIIAYLRHGVEPVRHAVPASSWPADGWASEFAPAKLGVHPAPPFPTSNERDPTVTMAASGPDAPAAVNLDRVLRGRELVIGHACGACHGAYEPGMEGWLSGAYAGNSTWQEFQLGPFLVLPRNLTPDNLTGMGRFSERQIFNALRYGLRPGETADVEITSSVPGVGNHPEYPKYLAPAMPWAAFRHRSDQDLWDVAYYLKHGVAPVSNRVAESDGPPDFWVSVYSPDDMGDFPLPPFPTDREQRPEE